MLAYLYGGIDSRCHTCPVEEGCNEGKLTCGTVLESGINLRKLKEVREESEGRRVETKGEREKSR